MPLQNSIAYMLKKFCLSAKYCSLTFKQIIYAGSICSSSVNECKPLRLFF